MGAEGVKRGGGSEQGSVSGSGVDGAMQPGYMTISRLEKPTEGAYSKASTCTTDATARRRGLARGERERIRLELLGDLQRTKGSSLRHGYTSKNTLKLPTHLASYISEIWKSSIQ